MVESSAASVYDDPVYAKFKNVLKGAEMVSIRLIKLYRAK